MTQSIIRHRSFPRAGWATLSVLALTLAGCGGDSSTTANTANTGSGQGGATVSYQSKTVDATSTSAYRYLNLGTGAEYATEAEANAASGWHIAFRRTGIMLNGGTSGSGKVAGALLIAQDDFYEADGTTPKTNVFLAATPASELEHLTGTLPAAGALTSDGITTALAGSGAMVNGQMDMGWFWYNPTTHVTTANETNGWLLRSAEGSTATSYARFRARANSLVYNPATSELRVSFDFDVQPAGTSQFTSTAAFDAVLTGNGETCFDFNSNATVACTEASWDLKLGVSGRNWYLRSNGGVSGSGNGAALGPLVWTTLSTYPNAQTNNNSETIPATAYIKDASSGIFAQKSWYAYNLEGTHKIYPNYRVYLVATDKDDTSKPRYAVQLTSYYGGANGTTSGHISLRWRAVTGN